MQIRDSLFLATFVLMLLFAGSQAVDAQVTSNRRSMSQGNNYALTLEFPNADDKLVRSLWEEHLKDNYKAKPKKVKKSRGETMAKVNGIPGVTVGTKADIYSAVNDNGSGSELVVWIATPDGYVSPELGSGRYLEAEKMLMRFALDVSREQIRLQIEDEEDALRDLEKDLDKLRKDKERFEKDILDAERAIQEARNNIDRNLTEQEAKQNEIEAQIQKVEGTKRRLKDF